ncbi:hypothetical protein PHJA_002404300 [Phtheirospermum japonicum]|uniref:Uncharacterized protein n=1 Tax=Phtheirospermum japonicum TaxID=374723 RepID=A0A830CWD1_9LAMI|nr:hypothetical protein PHJA_002404300 [Phtheirospermum japonicum]
MENEGNPSKMPAVNVDSDEDQREEEELTVTDSGVVVTEKREQFSSFGEAQSSRISLRRLRASQMIKGCPPFLNRKEIEVAKAYVDNERPPFQAPVKHFSCGLQQWGAALQHRSWLRLSRSREKVKLLQQARRLYEDALDMDSGNRPQKQALSSYFYVILLFFIFKWSSEPMHVPDDHNRLHWVKTQPGPAKHNHRSMSHWRPIDTRSTHNRRTIDTVIFPTSTEGHFWKFWEKLPFCPHFHLFKT